MRQFEQLDGLGQEEITRIEGVFADKAAFAKMPPKEKTGLMLDYLYLKGRQQPECTDENKKTMFHELRSNAKIEKLFEKLTTMSKDGSALLEEAGSSLMIEYGMGRNLYGKKDVAERIANYNKALDNKSISINRKEKGFEEARKYRMSLKPVVRKKPVKTAPETSRVEVPEKFEPVYENRAISDGIFKEEPVYENKILNDVITKADPEVVYENKIRLDTLYKEEPVYENKILNDVITKADPEVLYENKIRLDILYKEEPKPKEKPASDTAVNETIKKQQNKAKQSDEIVVNGFVRDLAYICDALDEANEETKNRGKNFNKFAEDMDYLYRSMRGYERWPRHTITEKQYAKKLVTMRAEVENELNSANEYLDKKKKDGELNENGIPTAKADKATAKKIGLVGQAKEILGRVASYFDTKIREFSQMITDRQDSKQMRENIQARTDEIKAAAENSKGMDKTSNELAAEGIEKMMQQNVIGYRNFDAPVSEDNMEALRFGVAALAINEYMQTKTGSALKNKLPNDKAGYTAFIRQVAESEEFKNSLPADLTKRNAAELIGDKKQVLLIADKYMGNLSTERTKSETAPAQRTLTNNLQAQNTHVMQ